MINLVDGGPRTEKNDEELIISFPMGNMHMDPTLSMRLVKVLTVNTLQYV